MSRNLSDISPLQSGNENLEGIPGTVQLNLSA